MMLFLAGWSQQSVSAIQSNPKITSIPGGNGITYARILVILPCIANIVLIHLSTAAKLLFARRILRESHFCNFTLFVFSNIAVAAADINVRFAPVSTRLWIVAAPMLVLTMKRSATSPRFAHRPRCRSSSSVVAHLTEFIPALSLSITTREQRHSSYLFLSTFKSSRHVGRLCPVFWQKVQTLIVLPLSLIVSLS